jgi:hypothetical protein
MVTRVSFDHSSGSFIDHEDQAFNTSVPTYEPGAPLTRVHTGGVRITNGDAEAVPHASGSYSMPITGTAGDSVASTLQTRYGPPSVELEPGNPSTRTSVEVAARMGLIRRDDAGNWLDAGTVDQQATARDREFNPQPEVQEQHDPSQVFEHAQAVAFADAIEPIPQHAFDVAQAHAMAGVFEGQSFSQAVAEVSERLAQNAGGVEPSQVTDAVRQGFALYEAAVAKVAAAEGISPDQKDAFYASLRQGNQAGLQDALSRLVYGNDPTGFRALARSYANANPGGFVEVLKSAGFEVSRSADGWLARKGSGEWVPVSQLEKHASTPAPAAPPRAPARAPAAPAGSRTEWFDMHGNEWVGQELAERYGLIGTARTRRV